MLTDGTAYGTIQGMDCVCIVQIPLTYGHDGRPVDPEVLAKYLRIFDRQFGGYTPLGLTGAPKGVASGGLWHGEEDVSFRVEIAVPEGRTEEFEAIAYAIGKELRQKEMYIHIGPPAAKFLKIHEEDENDQGQDNVREGT